MRIRSQLAPLAVFIAATTWLPQAKGSVLLLDFSGGFGTPPGSWNVISDSEVDRPLIDSAGSDSGVRLTNSRLDIFLQNGISWGADTLDWVSDPAATDMLGTRSTAQVSFIGLPASSYRLELVSAFFRDTSGGIYEVQGQLADTTFSGAPPASPWLGATHGRRDWMIWESVTPRNGAIGIDITNTATLAGISAIRLTSIPEPSSLTLTAVCALALCRRRR